MQKKKIHILLLCLLLAALSAGCGEKKKKITDGSEVYVRREEKEAQEDKEEAEELQQPETLYVVTGIDADHKLLTLRDCETAKERPYSYSGGTYIKDKYGSSLTVGQLSLGELVTIEQKKDILTTVQISKEAFFYDDLHNYTLDKDQKSLTVGSDSYYYDEELLAYHDGSRVSVSEISEQDKICLKGVGQKIYVILVETGHGTVVLENTETFQGGYITIGNILSRKITPQMRIEVAEGTYVLAVANNGYGGSRNITVEANTELKVNLDELKGEGPKRCKIQFKVTPENTVTKVYLDGELADISQPIEVSYGTHRLQAEAEGYASWNKTLIVNSASAEIVIELKTEEEAEKDDTVSTSGSTSGNTGSSTGGAGVTRPDSTGSNMNHTVPNRNNNNSNNNSGNKNSNNNNSNNNNSNNNNSNNNNNNSNNNNNNNSNNNNGNNNNNNSNNNNGNDNNNNSNGSNNDDNGTGSGSIYRDDFNREENGGTGTEN